MIISVHLADVGLARSVPALGSPPRPDPARGLRWAAAVLPLTIGHVPPRPRLGRIGLIAAWSSDEDLDHFLTDDPWSRHLTGGYDVRLAPLRTVGSWAALPELQHGHDNGSVDEPVGVLTLGQLRTSQALRFLRATAIAERSLLTQPALSLSVRITRPPFLATFSLWSSTQGMQDYTQAPGHTNASTQHTAKPFHHQAAFTRVRPYRTRGTWTG